jgi:hypothetical protein
LENEKRTIIRIPPFKGHRSLPAKKILDDAAVMLMKESDFNLTIFLSLNMMESEEYLGNFKEFNDENTELLADCIYDICMTDNPCNSKVYLEKALQLYELCNTKSKTYSLQRQSRITAINNLLF